LPLFVCALAAGLLQAAEEPALFSELSFDAALKQAGDQKKIVFVDFYTTWCGPCKQLDRTTWQDKAAISLLREKSIPLRIDAEKETSLAERFKISAYPTLLLVKPDGSVIDRLVGFRDAAKFIAEFNSALAGGTALSRARAVAEAAKGDGRKEAQARYDLAQALARAGENAEALKEYGWLYDEGMKREPSFAGVRNSFLLGSFETLGKQYPPALAALRERRDAGRSLVEKDTLDASAATDLAALDRALGEDHLTLKIYEALPANSPNRRGLGTFVFGELLAARRYNDALAAQPFDQFLQRFEMMMNHYETSDFTRLNPQLLKQLQSLQIGNAAQEIEALAGAGKLKDASQLIDRVRAIDKSDETLGLLRKHLDRAGQAKLLDLE
jgi:thioredoxin-like negative regulator of GroEL